MNCACQVNPLIRKIWCCGVKGISVGVKVLQFERSVNHEHGVEQPYSQVNLSL